MKIIRKLTISILGEIKSTVKIIHQTFTISSKIEKINPESMRIRGNLCNRDLGFYLKIRFI